MNRNSLGTLQHAALDIHVLHNILYVYTSLSPSLAQLTWVVAPHPPPKTAPHPSVVLYPRQPHILLAQPGQQDLVNISTQQQLPLACSCQQPTGLAWAQP